MAALTSNRKIDYVLGQGPIPTLLFTHDSSTTTQAPGLAASTTLYVGAMVAIDANGYVRPARANSTDKVIGVWFPDRGREIAATAVDGAVKLNTGVRVGVFPMNNSSSTDLIAATEIGKVCYVVDDNTVAKTSNGGTRPVAGVVQGVRNNGTVEVFISTVVPDVSIQGLAPTLANFATLEFPTASTNATVTETVVYEAPLSGTVTGVSFNSTGVLAANGTNYFTAVVKRGASGVAAGSRNTVGTLTTNTTGGVSLAAFTRAPATLSGTAADLNVVKGDLISLTNTLTGTGITFPAGAWSVYITPT